MKKRNTPTKQKVWDVISKAPYALCHEDIIRLTNNQIDKVTIYRIIQSFTEDGLIHKIVDISGKAYYALCAEGCCSEKHEDNHMHFKCVKCEQIICMEQNFVPTLPKQYDYLNVNCLVEGVCPECKEPKLS